MTELEQFFAEYPHLYQLSMEATKQFKQHFQNKGLYSCTITRHEGEAMLVIHCIIQAEDIPDPDAQLAAFDEWWLSQCHCSDGRLIFDYIIRN